MNYNCKVSYARNSFARVDLIVQYLLLSCMSAFVSNESINHQRPKHKADTLLQIGLQPVNRDLYFG